MRQGWHKQNGFTIVELLIVIVVIAVLAAISIVAYNGIQQRARDADRKSGIAAIVKALENYYTINGRYPNGSGSTVINSSWSTTADASWQNLENTLVPTYISKLPTDPISTPGANMASSGSVGYDYAYFANTGGTYCGTGPGQTYILLYRLEGSAQVNALTGDCTVSPIGPYAGASNVRTAKN